jgi:hypothetical protein
LRKAVYCVCFEQATLRNTGFFQSCQKQLIFMGDDSQQITWQIETPADLKGLKDAKAALEEAIKSTKAMGGDSSHLEGELRKVDLALSSGAAEAVKMAEHLKQAIAGMKEAGGETKVLEEQLKGLQNRMAQSGGQKHGFGFSEIGKEIAQEIPGIQGFTNLLGGAVGKLAALGAATALVFEKAKEAIQGFEQAQATQFKIDAALAQTGNLTSETREKISGLIHEMKELTGVGGGEWSAAITRLIQFGADPSKLKEYTEAVKNLAGIMDGDVAQASHVFSRAMQGNFEMLHRYGINVEEAANQTEKMDKLMSQLALRGGGQLESQTKTLAGETHHLKEGFESAMKSMGFHLATTLHLADAMGAASTVVDFWADKLKKSIPVAEGLANANRKTTQTFDDLNEASTRTAEAVARMHKESEEADKAADREVAGIEKQKAAMLELEAEQKKMALARLANWEAQDPENRKAAAEVARSQIEGKSENERRAIQAAAADKKIGTFGRQITEAEAEYSGAAAHTAEAERRRNLLQEDEKLRSAANEQIKRLNKSRDKLAEDESAVNQTEPRTHELDTEMEAYRAEIEAATKALDALQKKRQEIGKQLGPGTMDVKAAEAEATQAKKFEEEKRGQAEAVAKKNLPLITDLEGDKAHAIEMGKLHGEAAALALQGAIAKAMEKAGPTAPIAKAGTPQEAEARYQRDNAIYGAMIGNLERGGPLTAQVAKVLNQLMADRAEMLRELSAFGVDTKHLPAIRGTSPGGQRDLNGQTHSAPAHDPDFSHVSTALQKGGNEQAIAMDRGLSRLAQSVERMTEAQADAYNRQFDRIDQQFRKVASQMVSLQCPK